MIFSLLFLPVLVLVLVLIDHKLARERLTRELRDKQRAARRKHAVYLSQFRNQ